MSEPSSRPLPRSGDIIDGKYALEDLLGKGGMGAVYAARHLKLGHRVAIKVMFADASNPEAAQRFIREGSAIANIQNDHVVRVFDVDEENGYAYMVLELLEGEDLGDVLRRDERLPFQTAVNYVLQALDGVKQAHAQGIVHRDLKPSNLFLAKRQDGSRIVKVLDFGISKANSSSALGQSPSALTSTKAMLGSPLYMSPEQLRSSKSVDARADIWAIGVILYELIAGKLPFHGENLGELFAAILETNPVPLRTHAPDVPANLEAIVARCLQRTVEHRFQTAAELEHALAPFSSTMPLGSPFAFSAVGPHGQMTSPMSAGPMTSPMSAGPMTSPVHTAVDAVSRPPVAMRTVPLGAITPQPQQQSQAGLAAQSLPQQRQTGNTWQSTGDVPKKSNVGMIVALVSLGLVGLLGIAFFGVTSWRNRDVVPGSSPSSIPTVALSSSATPNASASESASVAVAPSAPPSAPPSSTAKETAPPPTTPPAATTLAVNPRHPPVPTTKPEPRPPVPEPPKTATTPPRPPPTPTPTTPSTGGGTLQPNR